MADITKMMRLCSFNMRGARSTPEDILRGELSRYDVICFQETFLGESASEPFQSAFPEHITHTLCGYDSSLPIRPGRPTGGLAISVRKTIPHSVVTIGSRRLQGVLLKYNATDLLCMNLYLPYNQDSPESLAEFAECLDVVSVTLNAHPTAAVVLAGDFNCDLRAVHSQRGELVDELCNRFRLFPQELSPMSFLEHSYVKYVAGTFHKSLIDWFCLSEGLRSKSSLMTVQSAPSLNSDHNHVTCSLFLNNNDPEQTTPVSAEQDETSVTISRSALDSLTLVEWFQYQFHADTLLQQVTPPALAISCSDCSCGSHSHKSAVQDYLHAITSCLREALAAVLPQKRSPRATRNRTRRIIPGWVEHVRPIQERMYELHRIWKASGEPLGSQSYIAYSAVRREYHAMVRYVASNDQEFRSRATLGSLGRAKTTKEFHKFLRKSFPLKKDAIPPVISGIPSGNRISLCDAWAKGFSADFHQYPTDDDETALHHLLSSLRPSITENSICFDQDRIQTAMRHMASGKSSGPDQVAPEMLIHAPISLAVHLSLLFSSCERHAFLPTPLSEALVHPIPKPNKDHSKLENYRPITIGSTLGKLFESCIALSYGSQLVSSSLQYGFKAGSNTALCTMAIKGVARHYNKRGSRVFAALLDASKAFDRVNYCKIFQRLLLRGVPPSVVQLLYLWYKNTKVAVTWQQARSKETFGIDHSVRQGGILSPVIFALLYDDLLVELELSGVGCYVKGRFMGAFAFADDLTLLAPSVVALNRMLEICHKWALRNNLLFNAQKSITICLSGNLRRWQGHIPALMGTYTIPSADRVTHLGHIITSDLLDSEALIAIARKFNQLFHGFYQRFCTLRKVELLIPLYNTFCTSFYGLQTILTKRCSVAAIRFFRKSVNLALMRMLRLPPESVSPYLIAEGILNADTTWRIRALCFWKTLLRRADPVSALIRDSYAHELLPFVAEVRIIATSLKTMSRPKIESACIDLWMAEKAP